ncbi:hypothetical protein AOQ72_05000 [Bradyrhizobium yuanmingense]|uniref:Uncharacterized protein n=1 Tax=Bradyrhizobium yuanmingense TaxID=108015 RepID=A0A0R3BL63_9BRAD|nr:hypothetical protein [Bradyrhizobium yuanmingense]KRP85084.1 hypothetical protein AOQ72_05000 [Bradyrhizobium yuanmingense]
MMKTIEQMYAERLAALQTPPRVEEATRIRLEITFSFWTYWVSVLKPLSRGLHFGGLSGIFESSGRSAPDEVAAGMKSMKDALGVERLNFNTYFMLRHILTDACKRALTETDVDIALCAVMAFAKLELGCELDASYGHFPEQKFVSERKFSDADLSDNPIEAAWELEERHEGPDFGGFEFRSALWFGQWEKVLLSSEEFGRQFPAAKSSHANLLQVVKPIFDRLDPFIDSWVLGNFLRWTEPLLRHPLQERLSGRVPPAKAA